MPSEPMPSDLSTSAQQVTTTRPLYKVPTTKVRSHPSGGKLRPTVKIEGGTYG
jgi:hypothetical protein